MRLLSTILQTWCFCLICSYYYSVLFPDCSNINHIKECIISCYSPKDILCPVHNPKEECILSYWKRAFCLVYSPTDMSVLSCSWSYKWVYLSLSMFRQSLVNCVLVVVLQRNVFYSVYFPIKKCILSCS